MSGNEVANYRQDRGAWARRHNHALVALARRVWGRHCTLEGALALICETAAETLEVDRVNVWRLHPRHKLLRCVHAYDRRRDVHNPPGFDEAFDADSEYGRQLGEVRVIDATDVDRDATLSASYAALGDYLRRNQVRSLLDAPIRSEGVLLGVVCHECVGRECEARAWSQEDEAFAASIGDYVAMAYEIQRRREAEKRLRYLESHDAQTDLPNRDHLLEVAHSALRPSGADDAGLAAIHLLIDSPADRGDGSELVRVAEVLRAGLGTSVTLARVRDDAFALLPHGHLHETDALNLAERCVELVSDANNGTAGPTASAGIAFSRDLAAPSADILLRNAELASQRARTMGALNRCEIFDAEHHRGLLARLRTERALREAFDQDRLHVHYQPVVDLATGRACGAEALLRWRGEEGQWRSAADFLGVAESSGLIVTLGRWVLQEACRDAASWPPDGEGGPTVGVNVSARQFEHPGLVADVAAALQRSGLPGERLYLELTETALLAETGGIPETLARLRALGVRVALDDFGTGYSSLSHLKRLPIDILKIDRDFIAGLPGDRHDVAIVRAIATLAEEVGIAVVAEGVETAAQVTALRRWGIERGQGFLFAPALDAGEMLARFTD